MRLWWCLYCCLCRCLCRCRGRCLCRCLCRRLCRRLQLRLCFRLRSRLRLRLHLGPDLYPCPCRCREHSWGVCHPSRPCRWCQRRRRSSAGSKFEGVFAVNCKDAPPSTHPKVVRRARHGLGRSRVKMPHPVYSQHRVRAQEYNSLSNTFSKPPPTRSWASVLVSTQIYIYRRAARASAHRHRLFARDIQAPDPPVDRHRLVGAILPPLSPCP